MKLKGGLEITGATYDVLKLSSIKGTKYANKITPTNQVLKIYSASTLRPLGKCEVQLTNSRDKRKYKDNFIIVEDEHCVNLIGSKTTQQMQLSTIGNDEIKPCPGPGKCASTTSVDVNLTSNRQLEGLTLEHVWSQYEDVFDGLSNYLEARSVIEKVKRPIEWVNSVVSTRKPNGNLRLCLDPKPLKEMPFPYASH